MGGAGLTTLDPRFVGIPGFPSLEEGSENRMELAHINLEWSVGDFVLTSITGYAHYDYDDVCDCDFSAMPLVQINGDEEYDQYSQELRLTSPLGNTLEYIAGFYWQKSELDFRSAESFGSNIQAEIVGNVSRDYEFEQDSDMWAIFSSVTWNLADATRATLGLRYTEEEKSAHHVLDKRFTEGWTYPFGSYGDTPGEYDRFEVEQPTLAALYDSALWIGALGTFEHDLRDRDRDEENISWSFNLEPQPHRRRDGLWQRGERLQGRRLRCPFPENG